MLKVFAIRDVKADAYDDLLIVCPTQGIAKRSFVDAVAAPKSRLARYAADFTLYEIGQFDPTSGCLIGHKVPVFVMSAADALEVASAESKVAEVVS
jgi:hypothetical protein